MSVQLFSKIPLAWLQLTRNKVRLLVALMGITFASVLIFMQLAFLDSLYDSQTALHRSLKADLILINPEMKTLASKRNFSRQHLYRALNFDQVTSINYIYHGQRSFKYEGNTGGKGIIIVGINPEDPPFKIPDFDQVVSRLRTTGTVLFDQNSDLNEYGNIVQDLQSGKPITAEVGERKVWVGGTVDFAGASFADDGNLIVSAASYLQIFSHQNADDITIGLITLKPGVDKQIFLQQLATQLPENVQVMTLQDFIDLEKHYWSTSAPIGFVFGMGVLVGFLVGVIIVYQILYNEVSDHLPDYAVLKARGYKHRYFLGILFQEALLLALLGYIPGFAISLGLYDVTKNATALPIHMTFQRAVLVLLLNIMMCFMSGAISMSKLREADPAELF
ncbi:MAG: ABC transporter permease DevC [Leptolyngbyaceae cyanobacterium MO_188.B28]|nr:ABC transporter permease DevC [Leptolyngbyaceae cyanobacterium MO_188.B28]